MLYEHGLGLGTIDELSGRGIRRGGERKLYAIVASMKPETLQLMREHTAKAQQVRTYVPRQAARTTSLAPAAITAEGRRIMGIAETRAHTNAYRDGLGAGGQFRGNILAALSAEGVRVWSMNRQEMAEITARAPAPGTEAWGRTIEGYEDDVPYTVFVGDWLSEKDCAETLAHELGHIRFRENHSESMADRWMAGFFQATW
jgi:hypothetical protein